jgi:hypothetical protein
MLLEEKIKNLKLSIKWVIDKINFFLGTWIFSHRFF